MISSLGPMISLRNIILCLHFLVDHSLVCYDHEVITSHLAHWALALPSCGKFGSNFTLPCVSTNFQLLVSSTVQFYGIGGRTVAKLRQFDLSVIARFRPTILNLDVGFNALCNPSCTAHDLKNNIIC